MSPAKPGQNRGRSGRPHTQLSRGCEDAEDLALTGEDHSLMILDLLLNYTKDSWGYPKQK